MSNIDYDDEYDDDYIFPSGDHFEVSHPLTQEEVDSMIRQYGVADSSVGEIRNLFIEIWWNRVTDNMDEGLKWALSNDGSLSLSMEYLRDDTTFDAKVVDTIQGINYLYTAMSEDARYTEVTLEFLYYPE